MNIFDPHITGSLSVSASAEIQGDLTVQGTIYGTAQIDGSVDNAISASHAASYLLTSSFNSYKDTAATTGSNVFIGDQTISGSLLPQGTLTHDLGSDTKRWNDIYLAGSTIDLGGTKISKNSDGNIQLHDSGNTLKKIIASEIELGHGSNKKVLKVDNGRLKLMATNDTDEELVQLSGSFRGDGSGLINVPASGVTGLSLDRIASTTATASISSDSLITNVSIIPSITNTIDLGSPDKEWRDLYLSSGSLYINGQQVISTTGTELRVTTDGGESIKILETGSDTITLQTADGDITLTSSGTGNIELDAPIQITAGNKVISSDGNSIDFGNGLMVTGSITLSGTVDGVDVAGLKSNVDAILDSSDADKDSFAEIVDLINSVDTTNDEAFAAHYTASNNRFTSLETTSGSHDVRLDSLETKSGSLTTDIKSKLNSENVVSGSEFVLNSISPITQYVDITVTAGGGFYTIDGVQQQIVSLAKGLIYRFDVSDSSNSGHPFRFSLTNNTQYTDGVTVNGTEGSSGAYVQIIVNQDTPQTLLYYCTNHNGMGNKVFVGGAGDTDSITEGSTNLYYTDARAEAVSINNVVEDTTPQLGGNLDAQGFNITTTGKILYSNVYSAEGDLPSASTYHGMFAHVHGTGKGYFAHGGNWKKLLDESSSTTANLSEDSSNLYYTDTRVKNKLNAETVISGSIQVDITGTTNYNLVDGRLDSLETKSGSLNTDISNLRGDLNTYTSSNETDKQGLNNRLDSLETKSGSLDGDINSLDGRLDSVETTTASLAADISTLENSGIGQDGRLDSLETTSGSHDGRLDSIETKTGSLGSDITGLDGRVDSLELYSSSFTSKDLDMGGNKVLFGNLYSTEGDLPNAGTYHGMFAHVHGTGKGYFAHAGNWKKLLDESSSDSDDLTEGSSNLYYTDARVKTKLDAESIVSSSIQVDITGTTNYNLVDGRLDSIETTSGSHDGRLDSLETKTGSLNGDITGLDGRLDTIEGGLEFTGSNVTIKGDLLVKGTETRVDSTTVEIGDNIISLNGSGAQNAGIEVRDNTSPDLLSGSLIWDGQTNYWKGGQKGSEERLLDNTDLTTLDSRLDGIEAETGSYLTDYNDEYTTGATFNTGNGVVTFRRNDGDSYTVDLDGRFLDTRAQVHSELYSTDGDANDYTEFGIYRNYASNGPISSHNTILHVSQTDGNYGFQLGGSTVVNNDGLYFRNFAGTDTITGSTWYHIATRDWVDDQNFLTDYNDEYTTGATFNTSDGVITFTRNDGDTFNVDIDGRFLTSYTETDTLSSVTSRGSITNSKITIGSGGAWTPLTINKSSNEGSANAGVAIALDGTDYSEYGYRFKANGSNYYQVLYDGSSINWKHYTGGSYVTRLSLSNGGDLTATSFVKSGGTSSQFLKADGSVDSNTYLTQHPPIASPASSNNSGRTYIQDILLDGNGHVTGLTTATETVVNTNDIDYISSATFNTGTGVITGTGVGNAGFTVDIEGRYLPLSGGSGAGQAMTGNLHIQNGGPKIYLKDTTDDDDQAIYFQNNAGTTEYVISTQDFTSGGLADGMFIGSVSSDELGLVTNNTTALYIDTSQNSTFSGHIIPKTDATQDLGTTNSLDFRTLYVRNIEMYNQRVNISSTGTMATFSDHTTVGDGIQFNHLGTEILRLGNGSSTTSTFAGAISASGYNDGNWNTAYGWGDHSTEGYITGYTETDTLDSVTDRGSTTSNVLTVGGVYLNDSNTKLEEGTGNTLKITTPHGYVQIGSENASWAHITSNRTFYFGPSTGESYFNSNIRPYTTNQFQMGTSANRWSIVNSVLGNFSGVVTALDGTSTNWNTAYGWGDHSTEGYVKNDEYTTGATWNGGTGVVTFTRNDGDQYSVDISSALSEVTVTGGTYNDGTQTLTLTKSDGSTVDVTGFALDNTNNFTTGATFNSGNGIVTGTLSGGVTWTVDIDGRYLPLDGGTISSSNTYSLKLENTTNGGGTGIEFSDNPNSGTQRGYITHYHSDTASYGSGASMVLSTTEASFTVLVDGKLMYKEGIYSKPSTGTGAGTRKDTNWDTAYGWGDHGLSAQDKTDIGNLSGVNTGDQTLPTDFVSAANGGTFSGNVNVFPNAGTGTFRVGRFAGQEFKLHATDLTNTLTSIQDADENQGHSFILNREHAGSGDDDFKIQKDGSDQLTINKDGNTVISGTLSATGYNNSNWDTAYGWGDHSLAGYTGDQDLSGLLPISGGTLTGNLSIDIADDGGAPAMTALFNMRGYEGRGVGIKIKDNVNSASGSDNREWFVGSGYNTTGFNIGYSSTGSQSSYPAQTKLSITTSGNVVASGTLTATNLSGTNTGDQDLSGYLLNTTDTFTGALSINGDIRGVGQHLILNAGESYNYATGQGNEYVYVNAEQGLEVNSETGNWNGGWAARKTALLRGDLLRLDGEDLTKTNIQNFKTAYGWGDHSTEGYITGFTNTNEFTTGATFNSGNGVITFTRNNGGGTYTVDIDGRYAETAHNHKFLLGSTANEGSSGMQNWNSQESTLDLNPTTDWYTSLRIGHGDPVAYYSNTLAIQMTGGDAGRMYIRTVANGSKQTWKKYWHDGDFSSTNISNWNTAYGWGDHSTEGYVKNDEYTTGATFNGGNGIITFTRNDGDQYTVDISSTLTDVTVTGGTYNGGSQTLTLTKSDGNTVDVTGFAIDTVLHTTGATFNSGNGIVTFTKNGGATYTVDLDGRYVESESNSFLGDGGSANTHPGTSRVIFTGQVSAGSGALGMPTVDNSNAFLNINRHSGEYNSQLGFSSNGNIYYRKFSNTAINGTQPWLQVYHSGNFANNSSNWNTAYGWGDHSLAGYTGDQDLSGFLPKSGGTMSGAINMNGSGINMVNGQIDNVNHITIADPGPTEGIEWLGGNGFRIVESPNDLTTNSGGNLQFVKSSTRILTLGSNGQSEFTDKLTLTSSTSGSTIFDIQGTSGQLFSITDDLTGDLFAVSDSSGVPILNVNASGAITIDPLGSLYVGNNKVINGSGNIEFDGPVTTTNQGRGIYWTSYDKEGTTDFSDTAHILHTTNSGGLTGSVIEISSQNDAGTDGVNFVVGGNSGVRVNGNIVVHAGNYTSYQQHPSISAASSSNNSGRTYVQDILLDSNGHVTGLTTATETVTDSGNDNDIDYISSASFNTSTGIITGTGTGNAGFTVDIDGRYLGLTDKAADSEKLDGLDSTEFLRSNADDTTSGKISFTGGHGGVNITSTSIVSDRTSTWTGNPGTQGKIQYHSARWYIVSDSASDRIVQFRRDGSDVSYIHNNGSFIGNVTGNVTGNADYATTAGSADQIDGVPFRNTNAGSAVNADTLDSAGITYYTSGVDNFSGNASDGALYSQIYSSNWQHQIAGDYRSGRIAVRGKNNNSWQSWKKVPCINSTTFSSVTSVTFTHDLGTGNCIVQVYDTNGNLFFPSKINVTSTTVIVNFETSRSGRLVVTG